MFGVRVHGQHTMIHVSRTFPKNVSQIKHSHHRSLTGLMVNLVGGLIAYTLQPKKPSLGLRWTVAGLPVAI
jgi:hypothetical protein